MYTFFLIGSPVSSISFHREKIRTATRKRNSLDVAYFGLEGLEFEFIKNHPSNVAYFRSTSVHYDVLPRLHDNALRLRFV